MYSEDELRRMSKEELIAVASRLSAVAQQRVTVSQSISTSPAGGNGNPPSKTG